MKLLTYDDLATRGVQFSRCHLWRLTKAGKFPKPVKIGASRNAWVESEIDAHIDARISERDRTGVPGTP